ncbi:MAG: DUF3256 family protein [Bacteroides sp.]|nr:DUF3256 family protein [Bacteroides sp.]
MRFFIKRRNNNTKCGFTRITAHGFAVAVILISMFMPALSVSVQAAEMEGKENTEERKVTTARDAFTYLNIPPLEILKRTTRLDMLDYWDADSVYKATNAMNGLSWIEKCTPDYIKVQLTPVSTLELKMLRSKKDGVITMAVYTVGNQSQSEDSEITFSDEKLHQLDAKKLFKQPKLEAFFDIPKGSLTSMKEIREMIPFPTVAYTASPDNDNLEARLTVGTYMNIDDYNIVKLFLKPVVKLKWDGKEFKQL